jgi:hypothetical protein
MRIAAWTTVAYALYGVSLSVALRRNLVGWHLSTVETISLGIELALAVLLFRGYVAGYYILGLYGALILLAAAIVAVGAILTHNALQLHLPLAFLGALMHAPFAVGWICGLVAVWRACGPSPPRSTERQPF